MPIPTDDLCDAIDTVWSTLLDLELGRGEPGPATVGEVIAGCVHISGGWDGTVLLEFPPPLARRLSARMFGLDDAEVTREHVVDAVGEIANIVGGSVKTLLRDTCFLSLPTVSEGMNDTFRVLDAAEVRRLGFTSEGMPFVFTLLERSHATARRGVRPAHPGAATIDR